ncbi:MAG: TerB family tellurite resistance protein [Blastocatellia bacterium]|nr:TerB family tellurite resistance protein [Blastocatellia bacterium]
MDENILSTCSRQERIQFCRVVANMIAADHKLTEEESVHLAGLVWQAGLSMTEEDVEAAIRSELEAPSSLSDLVKGIEEPVMKRWLYRVMVEVAFADKELATQEREKLTELSELFGLNSEAAKELIEWTQESIKLEKREEKIMAKL